MAPDSFKDFCKGMLNRNSQILKFFLLHQESAKIEEDQILETEDEELRNEVCIIIQCSL